MIVESNIPLTKLGRKDNPVEKGWQNKYKNFPINKLKIGDSFDTDIDYEYGKTISIKNYCRRQTKKLNINVSFSVRKMDNKIRVWRIK